MRNGAGIHVRDRNNETPLMCAINADQRTTIMALRACGAHLQMGSIEVCNFCFDVESLTFHLTPT